MAGWVPTTGPMRSPPPRSHGHCGATALTWNMHVCSTLWAGSLADDLDMDAAVRAEHERRRAKHFRRIASDGAIYAQPFSEGECLGGGCHAVRHSREAGRNGWMLTGRKVFASLSGHADYYGVLCTEVGADGTASRRNTLYLAVPASAPGVQGDRRLGPAGHARHGVAHARIDRRIRRAGRRTDAARHILPGGIALASHVPDAVADLHGSGTGGLRLYGAAICAARYQARHPASAAAAS